MQFFNSGDSIIPAYDYQCTFCDHVFEQFHGVHFFKEIICPRCGNTAHKKISGGSGLILRGDGFYITDYKTDRKKS